MTHVISQSPAHSLTHSLVPFLHALQAGGVLSPSSPAAGLQVKWADPDLQHKKKVAVEKNNAENRMVSGVPGEGKGGWGL
jgi:hypothetical protein